jgi:GNAT superfamily N-acetyltransferase
MIIEERSPDDPGLAGLLRDAFAELVARYGPEGRTGYQGDARFLVALAGDGRPVGCVGLQSTPLPGTGEIKRLYVTPAARGRGCARALLTAVEELAADAGYRRLRLGTGIRQPEAIALYESAGWERTEPYGTYRAQPGLMLCFAKPLPVAGACLSGAARRVPR